MSLKDEIKPYLDSNGLVSNSTTSGTNNGVLYTSEYVLLLSLLNELTEDDVYAYQSKMIACMKEPGLLMRAPNGNGGNEGPDDYYGLAAGCAVTRGQNIVQDVIYYGDRHYGSFNNDNPGKWTFKSFLWRQPQLYACLVWSAGKQPSFPFRLYTALSILLAGIKAPLTDTDARILSWLVIKISSPKSLLCRLTAKVWKRRLMRHYPNGMKDVVKLYFGEEHPFCKYWPVY